MWNEKHLQKLQKVISLLLSETSDKGLQLTPINEVLTREIQYSADKPVKLGNIIKTLVEMRQKGLTTAQEFVNTYRALGFGSKLIRGSVKVFFPFNNKGLKKQFRINGQEFKILKKKEIYQYFEKAQLDEYFKQVNKRGLKLELTKEILFVSEYGESVYEVWENLRNNFSILQGIFDWACINDRWTVTTDFKSRTQFIHPSWILIYDNNKGFDSAGFNTNDINPRKHNISKNRELNRLLKFVSSKAEEKSTKSLICDCFRLYAQSMEAIHKNNFYLSLWQLVESACLGENYNGNTQVIIKRINLINQETKVFNVELSSIYDNLAGKRNELVHKGIDSSDMKDGNILLMLAENCIHWLYMHEKRLKTKTHIDEYFRLKTRNTKDRQAILETIDYLNKGNK